MMAKRATMKMRTCGNRYGLTQKELEQMILAQDGKCAICGEEKKLVVDHDHVTGRVRGLLCTGCNVGLGKFKDTDSGLQAAADYLLRGTKPKKGDLVLVAWMDFTTESNGDAAEAEPMLCQTAGFFHGFRTKYGYRFLATYLTQHPDSRTGADTYPMACVKSIRVIRRKEDLPEWGSLA